MITVRLSPGSIAVEVVLDVPTDRLERVVRATVTPPITTASYGLVATNHGPIDDGDPGRRTRPTSDLLATVVAGGNHHGLLMRNNTARGDQGQMVTPTDEPARTLTTTGHQSLVDPATVVDDCGFRMLEPYEVAAAMAFPAHYIPRTLSKKDQVKLAGNAVTPPVMQWIVGRIIQAMEAAV